jgi:hypothetical protein
MRTNGYLRSRRKTARTTIKTGQKRVPQPVRFCHALDTDDLRAIADRAGGAKNMRQGNYNYCAIEIILRAITRA